MSSEIEYQDKIKLRHSNYIKYCEAMGFYKEVTKEDLESKTLEEILTLMPQNIVVEEYKETFGYYVTKYLVSFQLGKIIDGSWYIEYKENKTNQLPEDQYKLVSYWYEKDLKQGLIKTYLEINKIKLGWFNEIKEGTRQISLGDSWEDDGDEIIRKEKEYLKNKIK